MPEPDLLPSAPATARRDGAPRVVILGGGPAGLGAAWQLAKQGRGAPLLIEQHAWLGGNAGSFEWLGQKLDFGSHRLHPACEPAILADLRALLGADLLDRPRHGRIRLLGKWIHFPLKPVDLLLRLDPRFALGSLADAATKPLRKRRLAGADTFASVLAANLGPTICRRFYFPYAVKLWGRDPAELSGIQARRRVSAGTLVKLVKKVFSALPGMKKPGTGRFFYPRQGFGQISDALAQAARAAGAEIVTGARVTRLHVPQGGAPWRVAYEQGGAARVAEADHVWSTLPVNLIPRLVDPAPPAEVAAAAGGVSYRAMLLVYLRLPVARFTEYDAHYFPEQAITITRLSEPKNYSVQPTPERETTLCAELPCDARDPLFQAPDAELGELVARDLATAGIPLPARPTAVKVMRLAQAYPVYLQGYERPLAVLDGWLSGLPRFVSYGRQGLFAHDNTHHALAMAYGAVDCLRDGAFDRARWTAHREVFATHVVED